MIDEGTLWTAGGSIVVSLCGVIVFIWKHFTAREDEREKRANETNQWIRTKLKECEEDREELHTRIENLSREVASIKHHKPPE